MDYIEIILKDNINSQLEEILFNFVVFDVEDIISSHFFDKENNRDISYQEVKSLKEYFRVPNTCNIYLRKALIGIELEYVLIHIACDEKYGDITINFEEKQFKNYKIEELIIKWQNLLTVLQEIYEYGKTKEIILGYEPAYDKDMKMLEISQGQIKIYNKKILSLCYFSNYYL